MSVVVKSRLGGLAVALVAGGFVLAACSSNSSSPTTTTPSRSSATTSAPSTTPTTKPTGLANCATSSLSGAVVGSTGAAGTIETTVGLKSTASSSCVLGGYPG